MEKALTVSEFIALAKQEIEATLQPTWVAGEIANFTCAASGHWYFSLRDDHAQTDCIMLRRENQGMELTPKSGDKVFIWGHPTLYVPRGKFQLTVSLLRFDGVGRLYQLFLERKEAWRKLGWFDAERKRKPPFLPQRIGVVCSLAGAAVHDVIRTVKLRLPSASMVLYPAPAQGDDAANKIAAAIALAGQRRECDVLLVCRGGGGLEDLWAYNEEPVVAAIMQSPIPVITGIGHEVDETLADYAADVRAATPTAAAAAATPDSVQLLKSIRRALADVRQAMQAAVDERSQRLDWSIRQLTAPRNLLTLKAEQIKQRRQSLLLAGDRHVGLLRQQLANKIYALRPPDVRGEEKRLNITVQRLQRAVKIQIRELDGGFEKREAALNLLSPVHALKRGYSIVYDKNNRVVDSSEQLPPQAEMRVQLHHGVVHAVVKKSLPDELL